MFTKSYTFIPYDLQDHKVQSWKKIIPRDTIEFWAFCPFLISKEIMFSDIPGGSFLSDTPKPSLGRWFGIFILIKFSKRN
jgi:hypothetical protein